MDRITISKTPLASASRSKKLRLKRHNTQHYIRMFFNEQLMTKGTVFIGSPGIMYSQMAIQSLYYCSICDAARDLLSSIKFICKRASSIFGVSTSKNL